MCDEPGAPRQQGTPQAVRPSAAHLAEVQGSVALQLSLKGEHYRFSLERRIGKIVQRKNEKGQLRWYRLSLGDPITSKTDAEREANRLKVAIEDGSLIEGSLSRSALAALTLDQLRLLRRQNQLRARVRANLVPLQGEQLPLLATGLNRRLDERAQMRPARGEQSVPFPRLQPTLPGVFAFQLHHGLRSPLERRPLEIHQPDRPIETGPQKRQVAVRRHDVPPGGSDFPKLLQRGEVDVRDEPIPKAAQLARRQCQHHALDRAIMYRSFWRLRDSWRCTTPNISVRNGRRSPRRIPISTRLQALLAMRRAGPDGVAHPPNAYVFGNDVGQRVTSFKRAWESAVVRAHDHTPEERREGKRRTRTPACAAAFKAINLHFHDLRHAGSTAAYRSRRSGTGSGTRTSARRRRTWRARSPANTKRCAPSKSVRPICKLLQAEAVQGTTRGYSRVRTRTEIHRKPQEGITEQDWVMLSSQGCACR